ncbi:phage tail protein [Aquipseudomonas alcaligenes]|uniref:Phage tail collar domain-containing protein n=1 Tax=Aquipseudomonas alcaligenes TaxID=43263 RepID=A0AA37CCE4_AQUAC|nr:phage tail protein [Pseudomonas alcaligenes]BCR26629.1 hypothetical protein KAM426_41560 [Pseudomonas alcaligenes]GIZ65775.1 hypothetical protein KAM428_08600 [Pseudomonas alcaligenes]GIZ70109.1 hypothetical protein KAM429_08700 [Pseudomonas alcaligenes]GIZ74462.1 hypothetical protein KAM430_08710 [Pseudomonas alcaligenes]GIZ78790.1 hypothetical protein KAM432_08380 [Pseudomonas alcaligenes]
MALLITITNAGRAEIINAQNTGTEKVTITAVAFGTGQYTPSKTQTALQSEVKRVGSIAGLVVADDTIHVMAMDESSAAYNVGEFGLISNKGTLIAVYSQLPAAGWIIQKAAPSTLLLATDIILESLDTSVIEFGDITFINPPATESVAGVTKLVNTLTSTDTTSALTAAMGKKLQDEKQANIAEGSTAQYWRGDKTWREFAADVRASVLTGLSTATNAAVVATDSLLVAIGKLQAQVNSKLNATANAVSASKLDTGRTIALGGDLSGSATFDGTTNITINAEVADNSHGHTIANVSGLQSALDAKFDKTGGTVQGPVYISGSDPIGLNGLQPGNGDSASSITNNLKITSWFGIGFSPSVNGQDVPEGEYSHWFNTRNGDMGWRGQAAGKGAGITELNASALSAGTVPDARLSGTYSGVNITGNAASATRLQTARTINGVPFDGTGNIVIDGAPAGAVSHFAMSAPPAGWLKANGAAVSRSTYAALFAAIGTTFGAGDGSRTFNLPDLRGEFLRGWDNGRGVDSGRAFGSAQAQAIQAHTHSVPEGSYSSGVSDSFNGYASGDDYSSVVAGNSTSGSTGGSETRPRNVALLACIKY